MEQILYRATIVMAIVLAAAGMTYSGYRLDEASRVIYEDFDHIEAKKQHEYCLSISRLPEDIFYCNKDFDELFRRPAEYQKKKRDIYQQAKFGAGFAVFAPLLLIAAFMVLRWIFTGRWRAESRSGP